MRLFGHGLEKTRKLRATWRARQMLCFAFRSVPRYLVMNIELLYGKKTLPLQLSPDWDVSVVRKKPMPILANAAKSIEQALATPVNVASLAHEAKGARSACILICDITRPVPNGLFLPILVKQLMDAGIPANKIIILVATGLHRPNEGEEMRELVGDDWVMNTVTVANHFARNDEDGG
jgi:lactate racemase